MSTNKRDFEQHEVEIKAGRGQQARAEKAALDKEKQRMLELQKQPVDSPMIEYSEDEDEGDIEQEDDNFPVCSPLLLTDNRLTLKENLDSLQDSPVQDRIVGSASSLVIEAKTGIAEETEPMTVQKDWGPVRVPVHMSIDPRTGSITYCKMVRVKGTNEFKVIKGERPDPKHCAFTFSNVFICSRFTDSLEDGEAAGV
jgi:hypothetical protein